MCLVSSPGSLSIPGRFLFSVPSSVDDTSTLPVLNTGTGTVPRYQKCITPDLLGTHVTRIGEPRSSACIWRQVSEDTAIVTQKPSERKKPCLIFRCFMPDIVLECN